MADRIDVSCFVDRTALKGPFDQPRPKAWESDGKIAPGPEGAVRVGRAERSRILSQKIRHRPVMSIAQRSRFLRRLPFGSRHPSGVELSVLRNRIVGTERFLRRRRSRRQLHQRKLMRPDLVRLFGAAHPMSATLLLEPSRRSRDISLQAEEWLNRKQSTTSLVNDDEGGFLFSVQVDEAIRRFETMKGGPESDKLPLVFSRQPFRGFS